MGQALNRDEWADPIWRLHHLYSIVDKNGRKQPFIPNDEQRHFLESYWYLNIILKARQLGFSTLIDLVLLDQALWVPDTKSHIIAQGLDEATEIFRTKVKFPYDNLLPGIQKMFPTKRDTTTQLEFDNGSLIGVGVSARSGTVQYLHVTELGKIARKFPEKAKEIESGALQAVGVGNFVFIESTAEGIGGLFHDKVKAAQAYRKTGKPLTEMDYKLHFYPWWRNKGYSTKADVQLTANESKYFDDLRKAHGIALTPEQKAWYALKRRSFSDVSLMLQEYPSVEDEPFAASNEDKFFGTQLQAAQAAGRIKDFPITKAPVSLFWDVGRDGMVCWVMQEVMQEKRFIDVLHWTGKTASDASVDLQRLPYTFDCFYLPHDATDKSAATNVSVSAVFKQYFPNVRQVIVPRVQHKIDDINYVRDLLGEVYIHATKCAEGIRQLGVYRKTWIERLGVFDDTPVHDDASHYADAIMQVRGYKQRKAKEDFPYVASRGGRSGY